jgi:hypothetical protein
LAILKVIRAGGKDTVRVRRHLVYLRTGKDLKERRNEKIELNINRR